MKPIFSGAELRCREKTGGLKGNSDTLGFTKPSHSLSMLEFGKTFRNLLDKYRLAA